MSVKESTTKALMSIVEVLEPLEPTERRRCINAAMVLLGEDHEHITIGSQKSAKRPGVADDDGTDMESSGIFGEKASRWMVQHKISESQLHNVFHINGGNVELIADSVPGRSRRDKTINCYLLVGIRGLLRTDEPRFADKDAIEYCQVTHSYDKNNHTTFRQALSNRVSGDRQSGFTLTVPGLRDAALLIKEMTSGEIR